MLTEHAGWRAVKPPLPPGLVRGSCLPADSGRSHVGQLADRRPRLQTQLGGAAGRPRRRNARGGRDGAPRPAHTAADGEGRTLCPHGGHAQARRRIVAAGRIHGRVQAGTMMKAHIALFVAAIALDATTADRRIPELLQEDREYSVLPGDELETWGWDLPDGGRHVKALADAAPGGAFDPRGLESIRSADLGYRARWRVLRYTQYGLDWDITGLQLTPVNPDPGLPTLAIIHGGSANWYEFFVDPLNRAGLGQFLAQRLPIILITIPGNYTDGGWTEEQFEARIPGYLVPERISRHEARISNAAFKFKALSQGF